ncbi:MAG: DUF2996 domain-containing protein [Nodosilinea sp.]
MADETTPQADSTPKPSTPDTSAPVAAPKAADKPAAAKAASKKEKPPALEDKTFTEFIQQDFLPSLETALKDEGIDDLQLALDQQPLGVFGVNDPTPYWQVKGRWRGGARQFNIVFSKDDISSPKYFYFADKGAQPSTIEQFMGDERRINLGLMVLYTLQRLNGQKWLTRN